MLQNLLNVVKANKVEIIKKGAIVLGAIVGVVIVAIATKNVETWPDDEPLMDETVEETAANVGAL